MGWDDWSNGGRNLNDKTDIEMNLKDKDVGLKEFEVEKVVTFVVRYKTLAKDKYELDHLYLGCSDLDIGDLENKKVYDFKIRNCGESEETKPYETGSKVEKEYWAKKKDKDFDEKEYDLKITDGLEVYF